ncbi:MAG: hypothetical protein ACE5GA_08630, partial [Candidatus Zixiibacteriota bacterium]
MILAPAIAAQDPGISDTLRVGSVQGLKGGRVSVPVYMFNDEILGGLTLVLKYDALALTLDTFLFDGGVAADFTGQVVSIDRVAGVLQAAVFSFDTSLIAPGTGLVGTLRFSVNQNTPQGAYI